MNLWSYELLWNYGNKNINFYCSFILKKCFVTTEILVHTYVVVYFTLLLYQTALHRW